MEQSPELNPATAVTVRKELALEDPTRVHASPGEDSDLDSRAETFVATLLEGKPEIQEEAKLAAETMGLDLQKRAVQEMGMLKKPIETLGKRSEDGGEVANALIELKMKVEELDPAKVDLEAGWVTRLMGKIPGVGTPLKRFFSRYESAQTAIAAILRSLEQGRDQLLRDNVTLAEDQKRMRETARKLERAIKLGQLVDQKLQYRMERDVGPSDPRHKFIAEELLFPLRQRILDLQQQLAVQQQGILSTEIIIRNNKELARGVNRALNVTVNALQVGVTVALALADQKIVLDKIQAVNDTTSRLLEGNAARLKTQGAQIQRQAASAQLDLESLKRAFADLTTAVEDLSRFRREALPQMASSIVELDAITQRAEESIRKMDQGNRSRPEIPLEID